MKHQILRLGLTAAIALAIPTAAVLANGPSDNAKSHVNTHASLPTNDDQGKPDDVGKPANAGEHPDNHGLVVSAVAKNGNTGRAHGEEVSKVARGSHGPQ